MAGPASSIVFLAFSALAAPLVLGGADIRVRVDSTTVQQCPNVANDKDVVEKVELDIKSKYSVSNVDNVTFFTQNGTKQHTITFPGCYEMKLNVKFKRPISNPYAEVFLMMGDHIPCRKYASKEHPKDEICRNKTDNLKNWCPRSVNPFLEDVKSRMSDGKSEAVQSCHFCNLCEHARDGTNGSQKFVSLRTGGIDKNCIFNNPNEPYSLTLDVCTPSKDEIKKADENGKLAEYWDYLKNGNLQIIVHMLERATMGPTETGNCDRLCDRYEKQVQVSQSYAETMKVQLKQICTPRDTYFACVYSTIKFTVSTGP